MALSFISKLFGSSDDPVVSTVRSLDLGRNAKINLADPQEGLLEAELRQVEFFDTILANLQSLRATTVLEPHVREERLKHYESLRAERLLYIDSLRKRIERRKVISTSFTQAETRDDRQAVLEQQEYFFADESGHLHSNDLAVDDGSADDAEEQPQTLRSGFKGAVIDCIE